VQSGGKNIELAVMRKGETLKVNTIFGALLRPYASNGAMRTDDDLII